MLYKDLNEHLITTLPENSFKHCSMVEYSAIVVLINTALFV